MEVREDETARGREGESGGKFFSHGLEVLRDARVGLDSRWGAVLCVGLEDGGRMGGRGWREAVEGSSLCVERIEG